MADSAAQLVQFVEAGQWPTVLEALSYRSVYQQYPLLCCCRSGVRTETSIVAETAQCFSTHHMAVLVGYGAHAVCPYLALETCRQWRTSSRWVGTLSTL